MSIGDDYENANGDKGVIVQIDIENNQIQIKREDGSYRMVHLNDQSASIKATNFTRSVNTEVMRETSVYDVIDKPSHYNQGGVETIEIIKQITNGYKNGFDAYCVGNSIKYLSRAPFKHDSVEEDINKARKYLEFLIEAKKE